MTAVIGLHINVYHGNSITRQETIEDTPERSLSSGHQPILQWALADAAVGTRTPSDGHRSVR